jgi:hypothetical protein
MAKYTIPSITVSKEDFNIQDSFEKDRSILN